ncbi:hypothetical protein SBOR_4130 [Sclerotinia borealis F-4128]|uniref:Uncharacterized protein n=1 Tax=Sclerotinia borealis (strain F-4128) TaxID=1432307 RepID=W9CHY7_SCLBF|nr:hypothetical protein SBOR_4130 [Sclerotinia borealis F-4128]
MNSQNVLPVLHVSNNGFSITVDPQPWRRPPLQSFPTIENDVGGFSLFESLLLELQGMIFKEAIPRHRSPVVDFFFEIIKNPRSFILHIHTEIPKAQYLFPLLNACKTSRREVYRQMKKIKISGPPEGDDGEPIHYSWEAANAIGHTYIDPVRDTLMLNIPDLMRLYRYGRSIDFTRVTRIALTAFGTDEEDTIPDPKRYEDILDLVSRVCPDIKVFQMVTMLAASDYCRETNSAIDLRIVDLDTEMWSTDFRNSDDDIVSSEHRARIRDVLDGAKVMGLGFPNYLAELKRVGREEDLKFWKNVKYTPAMHCRFYDDIYWGLKEKMEPMLYFFALDAWLPAHEDGTVLDKYKGLAQIFEGAPW